MKKYILALLFGSEIPQSILAEDRLALLFGEFAAFANLYGRPLSFACHIEPTTLERVGLAGGKFSLKTVERLNRALQKGRFFTFELFDPEQSNAGQFSDCYACLHKYWWPEKEGYSEITPFKAQTSVTLALNEALCEAGAEKQFLEIIKKAHSLINGIYGYIEVERPWGHAMVPGGTLLKDMISYQWHNSVQTEFKDGQIDMTRNIAHCYFGNFLSPSHLSILGGSEAVMRDAPFRVKENVGDKLLLMMAESFSDLPDSTEIFKEYLKPIISAL